MKRINFKKISVWSYFLWNIWHFSIDLFCGIVGILLNKKNIPWMISKFFCLQHCGNIHINVISFGNLSSCLNAACACVHVYTTYLRWAYYLFAQFYCKTTRSALYSSTLFFFFSSQYLLELVKISIVFNLNVNVLTTNGVHGSEEVIFLICLKSYTV